MRRFCMVLLMCILVSLAPHAVSAKDGGSGLYGTNLIVNGDAESGPGAPNGDTHVDIPGWKIAGGIDVYQYGNSGAQKTDAPGPSSRGKNYFNGSYNSALGTATQTIKLSAAASDIDTGKVFFTLSGWLGGFSDQDDNASVAATFRDASGAALGGGKIGGVTAAARNNVTGMLFRSAHGTVPAGTRSVDILLTMTKLNGSDDDAAADNLTLVLHLPDNSGSGGGGAQNPPASILKQPAANAVITAFPMMFSWAPVPGAKVYMAQVWLTKADVWFPYSAGTLINIGTTSTVAAFTIGAAHALQGGHYKWRVAAIGGNGALIGDWSPAQAFSVVNPI